MRDTMRLKASLLKMEVRDAIPKLEAALDEIEGKLDRAKADLKQAGDEAQLQAALGAMEARDYWESVRAEFGDAIDAIEKDVESSFTEAKLKASLDRMQAKEAHEKRKAEVEAWKAKSPDEKKQELKDFFGRIKLQAEAFVDTLTKI
ncbi:MAG: hypothetical protein AAFU77_01520 [Myxococcota bacterium]